MKGKLQELVAILVLTPEEKRVVVFVMLMIVLGVCVKEYRKRHPVPPVPVEVQKHPWMRKLPPLPASPAALATTAPVIDAPATPSARRVRKARKRSPSPTAAPEQQQDSDRTQRPP
ncbi:MAG: hypothetical protein JO354_13030 [Verrucomicrobia bacterium]|nr:hypothetical protein [Verrucomicrobiota bacterium]